jgi:penicillin amidase
MKKLSFIFLIAWASCQCKGPNGGDFRIEGLQKEVEIITDRWGVPHIYAQNEHDLFFAQGYQVAKDRLFQLEIFRRCANGTMAEVFGPNELQRDIGARLFRYRGNMDEELAHYHPNGKAIIEAFVQGINAYVKQVSEGRQPLPPELKILDVKPGYWAPDIVISRHAGWITNVQEEISVARMAKLIGEEKTRSIMNYHPRLPKLAIDNSIDVDALFDDVLGPYNAFKEPWSFKNDAAVASGPLIKYDSDGSNNWVVHGKKTNSGYPIMANDPHRVIAIPSIRYLVHLNAPGWNVIGGGEPVLPGVSIGHNDHGAWGLTIFDTDSEDLFVYKLNPSDDAQYLHKGKWLDFKKIIDTIKIKGKPDQVVELLFTVHGPVTRVDKIRSSAYAIKAAWLQKGAAPYLASLRFNQAKNWDEFRNACSFSFVPGENMVWADKAGNIGWQVVGIAPIRNRYSGMVPVPGDGRFEWDSILPIRQLPSILNPPEGFINTANANTVPMNYPHMNAIGFSSPDSFRARRAREVLLAGQKFSMKDMQTLQSDYLSIPARELVPLLEDLKPIDPRVQQAKQILMNWDYRMTDSSVAASIYFIFEILIERYLLEKMGLVNDSLPPFPISTTKAVRLMKDPGSFMNVSQRDEILLSALIGSVAILSERIGSDIQLWRYGQEKMKHVHIKHPLSSLLGSKYDIGPATRGGDGNTVNSTGSYLNQNFGSSVRFIFDCSDWDLGVATNTPGQSADPTSPHYKDLFDSWSRDEYFPLYFSKTKILGAVDRKLRLKPAGE